MIAVYNTDVNAKVRIGVALLKERELEIMESLAFGMLESEDAKNFVGQIPTIADLLPEAVIQKEVKA